MDADLKSDQTAPRKFGQSAVRPHAGARHTQQRGIFSGCSGHAKNAVETACALRETDVLQIDLRAIHVRCAVVRQWRPLRVERQGRQPLALRVPERIEVGRVHLCRLNAVGREPRRADATIGAAFDFGGRDESQEPGCVQRAASHRQRMGTDDGGCLGDGRKHLGPDAVLHGGPAHLMAVAQDVDAEGHRFAWLIGPVGVIRRHRDGDPTEWLARPLRQGRSHNTSQNRTDAEDATECDV